MTWEFNAGRVADTGAYEAVRDGVDSMEEAIELGRFHLEEGEVRDVVEAVANDHPLFIHFGGRWRYNASGGTVGSVRPEYLMGDEERRIRVQEIRTRCAEVVEPCLGMEPIDRELYVLDWIRGNLLWARTGGSDEHSPAGVLLGGMGVCDSISKATSLLLDMAGVDCSVVCHNGHSWNVVRIDGRCGHLDAGTVNWSGPSSRQTMINVPDCDAYGLDLGC